MSQILRLVDFPIFWPTKDDALEPWGLFFQDNATAQMEELEELAELHNNIMFYLAIILFAVSWIMLNIILKYKKAFLSNKYVNHGTLIILGLTIIPALIIEYELFMNISELLNPAPAPARAPAPIYRIYICHYLEDFQGERQIFLYSGEGRPYFKQWMETANYPEVSWGETKAILIPRSEITSVRYNGMLRYSLPETLTWKDSWVINNPFVKEAYQGRILAKTYWGDSL